MSVTTGDGVKNLFINFRDFIAYDAWACTASLNEDIVDIDMTSSIENRIFNFFSMAVIKRM